MDDEVEIALSRCITTGDSSRLSAMLRRCNLTPVGLGDWLMLAAAEGQVECAKLLIESGADVNAANDDGETALSFACAEDQFEIAQLLVQNGANVNTFDSGGGTPLDWAVGWASVEFQGWLRGVGAVRSGE